MRQTPIVSAVALLSLALGIGANVAIFSLVNALLLKALPVHEPGAAGATVPAGLGLRVGLQHGPYLSAVGTHPRSPGLFSSASSPWGGSRFNLNAGGEAWLVARPEYVDGYYLERSSASTPSWDAGSPPEDDRRGGGPERTGRRSSATGSGSANTRATARGARQADQPWTATP